MLHSLSRKIVELFKLLATWTWNEMKNFPTCPKWIGRNLKFSFYLTTWFLVYWSTYCQNLNIFKFFCRHQAHKIFFFWKKKSFGHSVPLASEGCHQVHQWSCRKAVKRINEEGWFMVCHVTWTQDRDWSPLAGLPRWGCLVI